MNSQPVGWGRSQALPRWASATALLIVAGLAGCGTTGNRAPVEDRIGNARAVEPTAAPASGVATVDAVRDPAVKLLPGAENAGKPGYYSVRPGDTLIRIGLENGQNWKDLVRWNALENPNIIEVGQVLRVVPPGVDPAQAGVRPVVAAKVETRPLDARPAGVAAAASAAPAGMPAASTVPPAAPPVVTVTPTAVATPAPVSPAAATPATADDDINWMWPAGGTVATPFDDAKSKGLAITGRAGDPVLAAADGRVVYAGSGLRGYGNLVILKHNSTYLTAYAHNQALLVKEDQAVRRGQKIAEMGSSDSDRVQLHFEIRKQGKPIDPAKLLPAR